MVFYRHILKRGCGCVDRWQDALIRVGASPLWPQDELYLFGKKTSCILRLCPGACKNELQNLSKFGSKVKVSSEFSEKVV